MIPRGEQIGGKYWDNEEHHYHYIPAPNKNFPRQATYPFVDKYVDTDWDYTPYTYANVATSIESLVAGFVNMFT